jgi:adenine-specific DNA-methyltransferase
VKALLPRLCSHLGTPVYARGNVALYLGDALTLLRDLPNDRVDFVLTSPPYNIGKSYETVLEYQAYLAWCGAWITELRRILGPSRSR